MGFGESIMELTGQSNPWIARAVAVGVVLLLLGEWAASSPPPVLFLFRTQDLVKAGTFAHDRCALQQLALNVHVKHSDLI